MAERTLDHERASPRPAAPGAPGATPTTQAATAALLALRALPRDVVALQRAAGNAAVGRVIARAVSPPETPAATQLPSMLRTLDPAVQAVLHRRGRARVGRPPGGWVVYQAQEERINFDWLALLFVLHRSDAASGASDYFTVLNRLVVPAIQAAARDDRGRTPESLPNMDVLMAATWARNPPPYVLSNDRLAAQYREVMSGQRVEDNLTAAATRARQANITDQSIPGRRDQDFAFIMGAEEDRRARNQFYRKAAEYYRNRLTRAHVVHAGSLEEVLDWIRARAANARRHGHDAPLLGTVYIVSHADELGSLSTNITRRGKHGFYPFELEAALSPQGNKWWDARGREQTERLRPLEAGSGVDAWTRVFIRGCDLGREPRGLNAMRAAFGGLPLVQAPRQAQYYGPASTTGAGSAHVGEGLADTYSLEFPADERVDDDELARRLAAKYSDRGIDRATFRSWLRLGRTGNDSIHSVSDYTVPWTWQRGFASAADVPRDQAARERAIREDIAADRERSRLIHFDSASWNIRASGASLLATGRTRYVHVHVTRRDSAGTLKEFTLRDREAYAIDVQALDPSMTTVPWH